MKPRRRAVASLASLVALAAAALTFAPACRSETAGPAATTPSAAAAPAPGALVATSDGGAPLPLDPAIVTGKLGNGLTYYVRRNGKPAKRAEVWLAIDAGSALEDDDQRGLAHFLEHMAFNGTRKYGKQAIIDWLETIGMRFGPDVNAETNFDHTIYQLQVPTDDPATVTKALDVLHEWAGGITNAAADVAAERGVVLSERRGKRGAGGRLLDAIVPAALPGSIYGARLPIGTEESLKTATPERIARFYRDWYRPDLMAVIVVGDVEPEAIVAQIEATFAGLKGPATPRPRPVLTVPPHAEPITLVLKDPELPATVVAVASKQPRLIPRSEGDYRAQTVEALFAMMLNQRLAEIGRTPEAPFLAAQVGSEPILRPIDVWFQFAVAKGDRGEEALAVLAAELARVARFGFADSEIARAKDEVLKALETAEREQDTRESRTHVEELTRVFLTGESAPGVAAELALMRRALPTITAAEIQALAARAASEQNRVVLAVGNANATLPTEAALLAAVAAGAARATAAYVDHVAAGPLVATPPKPATIARRRTIADLGVTEWTLSNGARVVLKPTDFEKDRVAISAFALGGSSTVREAEFVAAENAPAIALAGGAGELTLDQLNKALAGTGVSVVNRIGRYDQGFSGGARADQVERLLQTAFLQLTAPRKDAAAIEAWRAQQVEARRRQLDDPGTVFQARMIEASTRANPRARLLTSDDFAAIDADRAIALYRERFGHGRGLTVVIVGAFALDAIEPHVLTWIGGLPRGKAGRWRDLGIARPRGELKVEVVKGVEPKAQVELLFHRRGPWSPAVEADVEALADVLAIRLREELREGMGATYSVGVGGHYLREPRAEAIVDVQFGCAPESVEPMLARTRQLIEELQKIGPPPEVVDKVREAARRDREVALAQNGFWLNQLYGAYRFGDDPAKTLAEHDRQLAAMTPPRVRDAARRYLGKDVVVGVLRPATPATPAAPAPRPEATAPASKTP